MSKPLGFPSRLQNDEGQDSGIKLAKRLASAGLGVLEARQRIADRITQLKAPIGIHEGIDDRQGITVGTTPAAVIERGLLGTEVTAPIRKTPDRKEFDPW